MAKFFYRVRNPNGTAVTGFLEAPEETAVANALRRGNYTIVEIRPVSEKTGGAILSRIFEPQAGKKELALFCRQLAAMLGAGIPLLQSLDVLRAQTENKKLQRVIFHLTEQLRGGAALTEAMQMFPEVFSPVMLSMVEVGELGGVLEQVLENLAAHFEKEHYLKEKIKSAMIYPAIVLGMATIVMAFFTSFVLPNFVLVLKQLQVELPFTTRFLVKAGEAVRNFWFLFLVGAAISGYLAWRFFHFNRGSAWIAQLALKLPFFGGLLRKTAVARFCRTTAMLIRSGVPLLRALSAVKKATGNPQLNSTISTIIANVREGRSIAGPLARSGIFPPMVVSLAAVGEETGALDTLLEKAAIFYEREVDETVSRLAAVIEPVIIAVVGVVVGFVVISFLLPVLQTIGGIGY
ncbi:MAG: type II secretion system F family protein [Bacillota bacterium]